MDYRSIMSKIFGFIDPKKTKWKEEYIKDCGYMSTGGVTRIKRKEFYDGRCGSTQKPCNYENCRYKEN